MNDMVHAPESKVTEAERELALAREHFKETLRDVSTASQVVVRRAWQSGKPVIIGAAVLIGFALLLGARKSRRQPLLQIRVIAPRPALQQSIAQLALKTALGVLVARMAKPDVRSLPPASDLE